MAMKLKVYCSMCGSNGGLSRPLELDIEYKDDLELKTIQKLLQRKGWVVQVNGDHIDTYCSKRCAK